MPPWVGPYDWFIQRALEPCVVERHRSKSQTQVKRSESSSHLFHFNSRINQALPSSHSALAFDFDSFVSAATSSQFISK